MQLRSDVTGLAVVILATGAILGAELGGPWLWLHYLCKPLAMVMIITTLNVPGLRVGRYRTAVLVGMLSSLAGDVLLMLPQDLFVPGLLAFLLAHLCYIVAFIPGGTIAGRLVGTLGYAVFAGINLALLLPRVPADMRVPVLAYVLVLVVMAAAAAARAWSLRRDPALAASARMAALGALLFVASDSVLAWDRFSDGVSVAVLPILSTYFAAQWCIARSVVLKRADG